MQPQMIGRFLLILALLGIALVLSIAVKPREPSQEKPSPPIAAALDECRQKALMPDAKTKDLLAGLSECQSSDLPTADLASLASEAGSGHSTSHPSHPRDRYCTCWYRRGTLPPTSCSDYRCSTPAH